MISATLTPPSCSRRRHVKVVSERLGHSSAAFTIAVYQHVIPGMQADAARLFCEALYATS